MLKLDDAPVPQGGIPPLGIGAVKPFEPSPLSGERPSTFTSSVPTIPEYSGARAPSKTELQTAPPNLRVLVIDDTPAIHEDFRKILAEDKPGALDLTEAALFGGASPQTQPVSFVLSTAYQGQEGLELVQRA